MDSLGLTFIFIGIILIIAEVSSPGFFIAIPAPIFLMIGILFSLGYDSDWIFIMGLILLFPTFYFLLKFYKKLAPIQKPAPLVGDSLIDMEGIVTREIIPNSIKGKVKIENQIWSATSDIPIKENIKVKVISSKGVHVTVKEIK